MFWLDTVNNEDISLENAIANRAHFEKNASLLLAVIEKGNKRLDYRYSYIFPSSVKSDGLSGLYWEENDE